MEKSFEAEIFSEEDLLKFLEEGYIECKKGFFGKKTYAITQKGKDYLEGKMFDKLKYIQ